MPGPYRIQGAIFPNERPNGPVFSGVIEIDGVKHHIALWEKTAKTSGKSYLSISEDKRAAEKAAGGPPAAGASKFRRPAPPQPKNDMDDDIPF